MQLGGVYTSLEQDTVREFPPICSSDQFLGSHFHYIGSFPDSVESSNLHRMVYSDQLRWWSHTRIASTVPRRHQTESSGGFRVTSMELETVQSE